MKYLVSGATGFIGRKLCQQLEARGHVVVALSRRGDVLSNGEPTLALDLTVNDPSEDLLCGVDVFFFSNRRRQTETSLVSWARGCV